MFEVTFHAKDRMSQYNISQTLLLQTLDNPDSIEPGYGGRKIYQKKINSHLLRVIVEEKEGIKTVITVYKSRSGRYGL